MLFQYGVTGRMMFIEWSVTGEFVGNLECGRRVEKVLICSLKISLQVFTLQVVSDSEKCAICSKIRNTRPLSRSAYWVILGHS
jgi:hypothetical protein